MGFFGEFFETFSTTMIALCLQCSDRFVEEARYVFQTIFSVIGINYFELQWEEVDDLAHPILVYFGSQRIELPPGKYLIHIAECFDPESLKDNSSSMVNRAFQTEEIYNHPELPEKLLYLFSGELSSLKKVWYENRSSRKPVVSSNEKAIHCSIDMISTAFYFLNLENERMTIKRDPLNRFHKDYSPLGREIYENPVVDHYYLLFTAFLKEAFKKIREYNLEPLWPQNRSFALGLSHDVDRIRTWTFSKAKRTLTESLRKKEYINFVKKTLHLTYSLSLKENWSGDFKFITSMEQKYGGNSTFFFASKRRNSMDPHYNLKLNHIKNGMGIIIKNGGKIGLHGSIDSSENKKYLNEEKQLLQQHLNNTVKGNRQHYLCFNPAVTFDVIESAGFQYDSTLGFSNEPGYRCGTSLPFQPFSQKNKKPYSFLEIPLVLMDTVLMLESKLHLSADEAWEIIESYLQNTHKSGFCLMVNWHNNNINPADVFGYGHLYERMLSWAQEKNAWICSPDDIFQWWIKRTETIKGKL